MKYLFAFFKLIRIINLGIIVFTQYMIKLFLIDGGFSWQSLLDVNLFVLSASTVCMAAAGYIINDYYDIKIDTINKPQRVIISVLISRRVAILLNFMLNILGLYLAYRLSFRIFVVHFIAGFLLWFYSNYLKRTALLGNIVISLLTSVSVVVMAIYYTQKQGLIIIFGVFAFFITIIREIIKDMEDVKGDATFGCHTLPIVWGLRRTKRVIYVFFAIFSVILLSTYFSFQQEFVLYLYLVVMPIWVYFFWLLIRADTKKEFHFLSSLCKWIMLVGVISMVFVHK